MNTCPMGQLTIEQVTDQLLTENALLFETINKGEIVKQIIEDMIRFNPFMPIYQDSNMFVLYLADKYSYLVEFINGCSRAAYSLDFDSTLRFFEFLNGLPL